jgi:hypothetical protein
MAKRLLINDFDEDVLAYLGQVLAADGRFRRDVAPGGAYLLYTVSSALWAFKRGAVAACQHFKLPISRPFFPSTHVSHHRLMKLVWPTMTSLGLGIPR